MVGSSGATGVPVNLVAPVVTGPNDPPLVGDTLSCSTGSWTNSPTGYTYQWFDNIGPFSIPFATSSTWVVEAGYLGAGVSCQVTASNGSGAGSPSNSNTTNPIGPSALSDVVGAFEADQLAALADGASVTSVADPYGAAGPWTPSAGTPKKQTFRGLPVLQLSSGDVLSSASILDSSFNTSMTCIYVALGTSFAANQTTISNGGIFSGLPLTEQGSSAHQRSVSWFGVTGPSFSIGQSVGYRYDGAHVFVNRNDFKDAGTAKTGNLGLSGSLDLGAASFSFIGSIRACYIWNRVLSDAEVNEMALYISSRNPGYAANDTYICVGDSQTGTTGGSGGVTYPGVMNDLLDANLVQYNYSTTNAVSGWQLQNMIATIPTALPPYINPVSTSAFETGIIWGGTNNITLGDSGAATSALLDTLIAGMRAQGCNRMVIMTCLTTTGDTPSIVTERDIYNAHIRGLASATLKVNDIAAIPQLMNPADLTYFNADGLHLNDAGKTIVGTATYNLLNPW